MRKIFIIFINISVVLFADFNRSGDIVIDNTTGLVWQDDIEAKTVKKTWVNAINYCEDLTLAGYDDWRLPNINELSSLVDDTKVEPAIDIIFQNIAFSFSSDSYWSSTSATNSSISAWTLGFRYGATSKYTNKRIFKGRTRCVRTEK